MKHFIQHIQPTRHGPTWLKECGEVGVRFNLWAPTAKTVELILGDKIIDMESTEDGWRSAVCPHAQHGDRYSFRINGDMVVPDPASRFQPDDVSEPSILYDPTLFMWADTTWRGRPWEEAVIYELHIGAFTPQGTYRGIIDKLDYLADLGITAIELMPVADFPGKRNWGYDGVLPYAPDSTYGTPDDLKALVDAAHHKGIMVLLDVVYNHFGPSGNFQYLYASSFSTDLYKTPWGKAVNVEGSDEVRTFFIDNALYWLNEFNLDGLRFDAVHAINDASDRHFLIQLADAIRTHVASDRHIHLILENDRNQTHYLERDDMQKARYFNAQWNDDLHHSMHTLITGEDNGYYRDYKNQSLHCLGRSLAEGFTYQGEASAHRKGMKRGEPSAHLPPQAFVNFLQNHDQIGNRAMGERLATLTSKEQMLLASTILLLSPQPPLIFMGEEWQTAQPWLYFCDFDGELADDICDGRRKEFASFPEFSHPASRCKIPDPNAEETFRTSQLDWSGIESPVHQSHLTYTTKILELRRRYIWPLLKSRWIKNRYYIEPGTQLLEVEWEFAAGFLLLYANFSDHEAAITIPAGAEAVWGADDEKLPPWKCSWQIRPPHHV